MLRKFSRLIEVRTDWITRVFIQREVENQRESLVLLLLTSTFRTVEGRSLYCPIAETESFRKPSEYRRATKTVGTDRWSLPPYILRITGLDSVESGHLNHTLAPGDHSVLTSYSGFIFKLGYNILPLRLRHFLLLRLWLTKRYRVGYEVWLIRF